MERAFTILVLAVLLISLLYVLVNPVITGNPIADEVQKGCVDSDGNNPFTRGFVIYEGLIHNDACEDMFHLKEYLCSNDELDHVTVKCPRGCKSDVCF